MLSQMKCDACGKKTFELRYWFEQMMCTKCYRTARSNPQTILVNNLSD